MKTLLILLFPISLFAQNISFGGSLDTSVMIVKVCKHGADWNHPGCRDTTLKEFSIALKTQTCNWCCEGGEVAEYPNGVRDTTNDYHGQKAAEKNLINYPPTNNYYRTILK